MKKLNKSLVLILAALLCLGLFTGCGTPANEPAPNPEGSDAPTPDQGGEANDSDAAYILDKGKLIVGITLYEPMNYKDEAGELTGFDTEFTKLVCEKLGLEPEFTIINWDTKEIELSAKTIDCIWNGMTINPDRAANMSISLPYLKNAQVIVVKSGSEISSTADLVGKAVVAEVGSAGEAQIKGEEPDENLAKVEYIGMAKQTDCLMEVKSGTADAAILDWTLAKSMVGEGTDYADLVMIENLELAAEEYGIAFRKGSDFTEKVNAAIMELAEDGSLAALAEKYGLSLAPALAK